MATLCPKPLSLQWLRSYHSSMQLDAAMLATITRAVRCVALILQI